MDAFAAGCISPAVSQLVSLKEINLEHNQLQGPLPTTFLPMLGTFESYHLGRNTFWLTEIEEDYLHLFDGVTEMVLSDCSLR